jgi:hypothetical protein
MKRMLLLLALLVVTVGSAEAQRGCPCIVEKTGDTVAPLLSVVEDSDEDGGEECALA